MKRSIKDKAQGTIHEVKGGVKAKVGQVTKNRRLEVEGQVENIRGKVQKNLGQLEKTLGK